MTSVGSSRRARPAQNAPNRMVQRLAYSRTSKPVIKNPDNTKKRSTPSRPPSTQGTPPW